MPLAIEVLTQFLSPWKSFYQKVVVSRLHACTWFGELYGNWGFCGLMRRSGMLPLYECWANCHIIILRRDEIWRPPKQHRTDTRRRRHNIIPLGHPSYVQDRDLGSVGCLWIFEHLQAQLQLPSSTRYHLTHTRHWLLKDALHSSLSLFLSSSFLVLLSGEQDHHMSTNTSWCQNDALFTFSPIYTKKIASECLDHSPNWFGQRLNRDSLDSVAVF